MKKVIVITFAALSLLGCRREDIKTCHVDFETLDEEIAKKSLIALSEFSGVRIDSVKLDFNNKTMEIEYDSMMLAKENIRQKLEENEIKIIRK